MHSCRIMTTYWALSAQVSTSFPLYVTPIYSFRCTKLMLSSCHRCCAIVLS